MRLKFLVYIIITVLGTYSLSAQNFFKRKPKVSEPRKKAETEYLFIDGLREFNVGNYNKALNVFEQCLKHEPQNACIHFKISNSLAKLNKLDAAITSSKKAIELEPNNKFYYILLSEIFEEKKMYHEAAEVLNDMLKKNNNSDEYYFKLAEYYFLQKKFNDAVNTLNIAEDKFGVSEEISLQKMKIYLQQNNVTKIEEEGRKLIKAFPEENKYKLELAEILYNNELTEKAEVLIQEVLQNDPEEPLAYIIKADIERSKGNHQKAEDNLIIAFRNKRLGISEKVEFLADIINSLTDDQESKDFLLKLTTEAIKAHPEEAEAYAIHADMLTLNKKNAEALKNYKKSTQLSSDNYKVWTQILAIENEQNLHDSILIDAEKALNYFPNSALFWYYLGNSYSFKKNYKKAIESFEQVVEIGANEEELQLQALARLGDSYYEIKDYIKSDESFDRALKLDSKNIYVLNNYSYYLSLRKEKLDLAKKMSEQVITIKPDDANYLDTYAWVLYQSKEYQKAKEILEKACLQSTNGTVFEHYGDALFQVGHKEEALTIWKKALKLGDTSDLLPKKIEHKQLYE